MEEHELKIELLLKQLELGKSSRDQCQQQRTDLEEEVRTVCACVCVCEYTLYSQLVGTCCAGKNWLSRRHHSEDPMSPH